MRIAVIYIHSTCGNYERAHVRWRGSYERFDSGADHDLIVIQNHTSFPQLSRIDKNNGFALFRNDDSGWDIGAYLRFANSEYSKPYDALFCCGGHCHFKRDGWLAKFVEAWNLVGPGAYGSLATYEVRPHFCTTGFMTSPELLRLYTKSVVTREDRYEFEHGRDSWHRMVAAAGGPVRLVTWDGIWEMSQWRTPQDIYRRGNQSNCVTFSQHTENFDKADPHTRGNMANLADQIRDQELIQSGVLR
jgi:hypothetical protein